MALKTDQKFSAVKMKLTFPKITLSLLSMGIFADWSALNYLVYQARSSSTFHKGVMPLQHWKPQSVLSCTHKPLVLAHLLYGQPLLFIHPAPSAGQYTRTCIPSWNPALVRHTPENLSLSQALSLKHSLKIWHVTNFTFLHMNKCCFWT